MNTNILCSLKRGLAAFVFISAFASAARAEPPEAPVEMLKNPTPAVQQASLPKPEHPFAAMAGTWTGGGTIELTGEIKENLRCRANYNYGAANNSLALNIRCASDNYKFELTSNVVDRGGRISGQWSEATYNVTGSINGRVAGNKVMAVAQSDGLNADIAVTTTGNQQSVTITPKSTYVISVQIAMAKR